MAKTKKEIEILISGDNESKKAFRSVEKSLGKVDRAVGETRKAFGALDIAIGNIVSNGISGVAGGLFDAITSIGGAVMDTAKDFRSSGTQMQQALGITETEAERLNETVRDVWAEGFGEGVDEANEAVISVKQNMRDLADDNLADVSKAVLTVSDVFEQDLNKTTESASTLMKQFGLDSDEALDFIAAGFQNGLDVSGDFLDTIGEYSNQFRELGFTTDEYFSILQTGAQGGMLGIDKVADAIKEYGIRIQDGSDDTADALEELWLATADQSAVDALERGMSDATAAMEAADEKAKLLTETIKEQKDYVKNLEGVLRDARREMDRLTQVETKETKEYTDQIEDLELEIKKTKLEIMDMEEGSAAFKDATESIDSMSESIERLSLQRDLQIAKQQDVIEATIGEREQVASFGQVLAEIENKAAYIDDLQVVLSGVGNAIQENEIALEGANAEYARQEQIIAGLKGEYEQIYQGASDMLNGIRDGSLSVADTLPVVLDQLRKIEDPIKQAEIGVALFGTQWEDMTAAGILAIDPFAMKLDDFEGSMDDLVAAGFNVDKTLTSAWRSILEALIPIGDAVTELMTSALLPLAQEAAPLVAEWLGENVPKAVAYLQDALIPMINEYLPKIIALFEGDTPAALSTASDALSVVKETFDAVTTAIKFLTPVLDAIIAIWNYFINVVDLVIGIIVNLVAVLDGAITPMQAVVNIGNDVIDVFGSLVNMVDRLTLKVFKLNSAFASLKPPDWLSDVGNTLGGAAKTLGIPGFADGGTFVGGNPIIVGERGPEVIVPRASGTVIPNERLRSSPNISMSINVQGNADQSTVAQIEQVLNRSIDKLLTQGNI